MVYDEASLFLGVFLSRWQAFECNMTCIPTTATCNWLYEAFLYTSSKQKRILRTAIYQVITLQ